MRHFVGKTRNHRIMGKSKALLGDGKGLFVTPRLTEEPDERRVGERCRADILRVAGKGASQMQGRNPVVIRRLRARGGDAVKALAAKGQFKIIEGRPDVSDATFEGNKNARVVIAEFSDFQCPFCKKWNDESMAAIRKKLGNDVALAFVHFPITQIHPNAGNASAAAICAGEQGKFWQMHDLLFSRQAEWQSLK